MTKKDTKQTAAIMPEFKLVPLHLIKPDPNQPRKYFSETDMQDLTDSVREKGILQPILIRPWASDTPEQQYLLVCGERRYRASLAVMSLYHLERNTIPAIIRELTDEEALELQIIENLQRMDVHPMEEAVAFKSLIDMHSFTASEIAARVGKSDRYVKQRVKLTELHEGWQRLLHRNLMTLTVALQLAQLAPSVQKEWFLEEFPTPEREQKANYFEPSNWQFNQRKGFLEQATFDITDKELIKAVGACTNCPYNSAAALLFPGDEKQARCLNIACFKSKSDIAFNHELSKAKELPGIVFIYGYNEKKDPLVKQLVEEGFQVIEQYSGYTSVQAPEPPQWDYFQENWLEDNDNDLNGCEEAWLKELDEHEKSLNKYQKYIDTGRYIKAFILSGSSERGKYTYVNLSGVSANKISKVEFEKKGNTITAAEISGEIALIKEREQRAKELDAEKVYRRIVEALDAAPELNSPISPLHTNDFYLINYLIWDSAEYLTRRELKKDLNIEDNKDIFSQLFALTGEQKAMMVKRVILGKFRNHLPNQEGGKAVRIIAEGIENFPIDVFETEQKDKSEKRIAKVQERIAELEKQKSKLTTKK